MLSWVPQAAVNAVYAKKIADAPEGERDAMVETLRAEYAADVDLMKLGSELIIDHIVQPNDLREELLRRFSFYREGYVLPSKRKHGVRPV